MDDARRHALAALTSFHELTVNDPLIGAPLLIRELTAHQRLVSQEAAQREDGEQPDNNLYQAMLVQMAVVDPASGTPYTDGRIDPRTGQSAIDPRTRRALFNPDDLLELMEAREAPRLLLVTKITALSRLLPAEFSLGDTAADPAQRDAGTGATTSAAGDPGDGTGSSEPADSGAPHPDTPVAGDGDTAHDDAAPVVE